MPALAAPWAWERAAAWVRLGTGTRGGGAGVGCAGRRVGPGQAAPGRGLVASGRVCAPGGFRWEGQPAAEDRPLGKGSVVFVRKSRTLRGLETQSFRSSAPGWLLAFCVWRAYSGRHPWAEGVTEISEI